MQTPRPRKMNRKNLITTSRVLRRYEPIVFGGTLLGLVRERDIIKGDDDVDFYVEEKNRQHVIKAMLEAGFICSIDHACFLQFTRKMNDIETYVDIYLYENDKNLNYIVEKWNFFGRPDVERLHLYIDKEMIFPVKKKKIFGVEIFMPRKPKKCCAMLYGENWRQPASKFAGEYVIGLVDHRPVFAREGETSHSLIVGIERLQRENEILKAEANNAKLEINHLHQYCAGLAAKNDGLNQKIHSVKSEFGVVEAGLREEIRRLTEQAGSAGQVPA